MNTRTTRVAALALAAGLVLAMSGGAQAALQGRDLDGNAATFEAYYDTDLNITWLANANVNGGMTWATAMTWAANLSFSDGINIYDNWRLPTSSQCAISNCTGSEMGYLFYNEWGGVAGQYIWPSANPDLAKFTNVQSYNNSDGSGFYWSGSDVSNDSNYAYSFRLDNGDQLGHNKILNNYYALAVSPGNVGIAAVPEAETWAMLLAGLGLVGVAARCRRS